MVSVPTTLRSEGVTELVGDIVITCTGGASPQVGQNVTLGTVTVQLSQPITSRVLGTVAGALASESVLMIDEPGNPNYLTPTGFPGAELPQTVEAYPGPTSYKVGSVTTAAAPTATAVEACTSIDVNGVCLSAPPNVFQGIINYAGAGVLTFSNIPIVPPGTTGSRVFRITNVRVSAPAVSAVNPFAGAAVNAFVTITTSTGLTLTPATVTVGDAVQGMGNTTGVVDADRVTLNSTIAGTPTASPSTLPASVFLQCNAVTKALGGILQYSPGFNGAFKTRVAANALTATSTTGPYAETVAGAGNLGWSYLNGNQYVQNAPGQLQPYSESGTIISSLTDGTAVAGLADTGTRLKAEFYNIPSGVTLYVSVSNLKPAGGTYGTGDVNGAPGTPIALLVASSVASDANGNVSPITGSGGLSAVTLTNGAGEAVWEVVQGTIGPGTNLQFGFYVSYPNPGPLTTAAGASIPGGLTPSVALNFAPTEASKDVLGVGYSVSPVDYRVTPGGSSIPIPRFREVYGPLPMLAISACQTTLLFPFTTNTSGFETGLAIANTSKDTLGTKPQNGSCTLTFFGNDVLAGIPNTTMNISGTSVVTGPNGEVNFNTNNTAASTVNAGYTTTVVVPAGGVWADTLTGVTGGSSSFEGYVFATCNFQYAHGYAFLTDTTATHFAQGYLALIVANTTMGRPGNVGGAAEALNQ